MYPFRSTGDNGAMAAKYDYTDAFRGASFTGADLTGAKFRDCDMRRVKIADSWLMRAGELGCVDACRIVPGPGQPTA
jgi:uncharacterized protein YjbI with pentapeptide repeats